MSTKILGNEELNILRAKTPYSLPDNPSDKGFNARQIKTKFWEGYLLLFNWLKDTQASLNNDFATTNSALLNESKRIDVILTYFSNGKANFAVRDRNNNIIDETYELKTEASTKFNQLIADIQSVSSASGNKIAGSQNINADGIQYTITLSNTQNATLSTITQYLPLATTLKAGLLSSSDKEKLNNLESDLTNFLANAKAYTDEKLQRDNIVNILGAASHTLIGLLTAEDKKKIDALYALLGEQEDADTVVNTINEVLAIFSSYPEGVDIVSQLEKKVNYSDIINTLDSEETSKPLSAKMGKELKTKVDTKAELTYVNEELDKKALKSDILIIDEAVTAQESEITTTQNEGDKLVDEIVGYVDGSPRGTYASLSALQSTFPSGAQGVYVCSDNGHWYYYNNGWQDGGIYQAIEVSDGSITPKKTNFIEYSNQLFNKNDVVVGYYNYSTGAMSTNNSYRCNKVIVNGQKTLTINKLCHIAYFNSNNEYVGGTVNTSDNNKTFTTTADTYYIQVGVAVESVNSVMLNYGNSILPLEEFKKPKFNDIITHYLEEKDLNDYAYTFETETLDTNTFELYQANAYIQDNGTTNGSNGRNVYKINCDNLITLKVNMGSGNVTAVPLMVLFKSDGTKIRAYFQNNLTDITLDIAKVVTGPGCYFLITRWRDSENLNTTVTIHSKKNNFVKKDELNFISKREFKGKRAVFYGDSITQGYTSGTTTTTENYVKIFSTDVGFSYYNNQGVAGSLFTSGYNSTTTITSKIKTADLNWLNGFDYLFIAGGVNDCQLGVSESDFKNAITDLFTYIKNNFKGKVIVILPIDFSKTFSSQILELEIYRKWINLYAKLNDFIVINGGYFGFPSVNGELSSLLFGDGLHPTELGHQLYAKELENSITLNSNLDLNY